MVDKYPSIQKVRAEIERLGLDFGRGGDSKSALELLDDARLSFEIPATTHGSGAPSLIAIRESINTCVAELIRRRPRQEEAKSRKAKFVSLGNHCGRVLWAAQHFENLGIEAERQIDLLSEAKQKSFVRSEVHLLFSKALLFLEAFLSSIDESKLRPN